MGDGTIKIMIRKIETEVDKQQKLVHSGRMKRLSIILLPILMCGLITSCQVKGMYATNSGPLPMNVSVFKKSSSDVQDATGPNYTYHSETINGDETIVPTKVASWWGWAKIAKSTSETSKSFFDNKRQTDIAKSNNGVTGSLGTTNLNSATPQTFTSVPGKTGVGITTAAPTPTTTP